MNGRFDPPVHRRLRAVIVGAFLAGSLAPEAARAEGPSTRECLAANEKATQLRALHQLREARAQLLVCAVGTCPTDVRDECVRQVSAVNASIPTLVFEAKSAGGEDLTAVSVAVDGQPLVDHLDGTPVPLDPGAHTFVLTTRDSPAITKTLVLRQGERDRREAVVFGAPTVATLTVAAASDEVVAIDDKVVGGGRWEGPVPAGRHTVRVTADGKKPYLADLLLTGGERRVVQVTLAREGRSAWPWLVGGAAVVVAGGVVGGYFLFRSHDDAASAPPATLGGVKLTSFR